MAGGVKNGILIAMLVNILSGCVGYYNLKSSGLVEKDLSKALLLVPKEDLKGLKDKATKNRRAKLFNDERALFLIRNDLQKDSTGKGAATEDPNWCVEGVVAKACPPPGVVVVADTTGGDKVHICVTPGAVAATCKAPDVFDAGTSKCQVQINTSCMGTKPDIDSDELTMVTKIYNEKSRWCGRAIFAVIPLPFGLPNCRIYTEVTFESGEPIAAREQYLEGSGFMCGPFVPFMDISKSKFPANFCADIKEAKIIEDDPTNARRRIPRNE